MAIFKKDKDKLKSINEIKIDLEKDIQKITEDNLDTVFGLEFVKTEFALGRFRIDTLAFDKELKTFVIIEYKKDRSFSVVDQGYSYLSLMLNNKADFILEYNEQTKNNLKRGDVDWSQSKVIFIANSFTTYQRQAINFKDLPIELYEVKLFADNLVLYNQLKSAIDSESIKTISKANENIKKVSKEIKKYSTEDHYKDNWESKKIFEEFRERVFELDSRIEEIPTKVYIGYKIDKFVLFDITLRTNKIDVHLYRVKPKDLKDPQGELNYINKSLTNWNKHVSRFYINSLEDIDYTIFLIKQVYKKFYN